MKHDWSLVLGALAVMATPVLAQPRLEVREARQTGEYAGVAPDNGHTPPRHGAVQRASDRTLITWPGFQMRRDGGSRFFLQVSHAPETQLVRTEGRLELLVRATTTHVRNTRRPLETRFFNTPVTRARVERRSRDLAFVFDMRADVMPTVSQQAGANGYHFVIVDFPPGTYVEGPAPVPAPASGYDAPRDDSERFESEQDDPDDTPEYSPRPLPPPGMRDEERPPGM
ncbi:MAG: hypothetical protein R3B40_18110 [Polyangiales bacterium]|nr:hypothetical protein [Myxococcales bacterium]MCB9658544.1 hypothetical protein [Sandaracinaceae bacterium]